MGQIWSRYQKENDQSTPKDVYKCIWYPHDDYLISGWNDNIYQMYYIFDKPLRANKIWSDILVPIENTNQTYKDILLLDTNIHNEMVAICNMNGDVGLLSKKEGLYKLETYGYVVHSRILKFNPSGTLLLLASYFGKICIWDIESRKLSTFDEPRVMDIDWQTDNVFAVANGNRINIHEYNVSDFTSNCILICDGHKDSVNGIQWDETRTYLASRSDDHTVKIWTRQSATCIENLHHIDYITDIKWCKNSSPTKLMIASALHNGTVVLWYLHNIDNPICISIGKSIQIIDFNITGQYLAVGCEDKVVVFEIDTSNKVLEYSTKKRVLSFAWNRSGKKLAACIKDIGINVYDIETKNVICFK